jgi:hypothetical protein
MDEAREPRRRDGDPKAIGDHEARLEIEHCRRAHPDGADEIRRQEDRAVGPSTTDLKEGIGGNDPQRADDLNHLQHHVVHVPRRARREPPDDLLRLSRLATYTAPRLLPRASAIHRSLGSRRVASSRSWLVTTVRGILEVGSSSVAARA